MASFIFRLSVLLYASAVLTGCGSPVDVTPQASSLVGFDVGKEYVLRVPAFIIETAPNKRARYALVPESNEFDDSRRFYSYPESVSSFEKLGVTVPIVPGIAYETPISIVALVPAGSKFTVNAVKSFHGSSGFFGSHEFLVVYAAIDHEGESYSVDIEDLSLVEIGTKNAIESCCVGHKPNPAFIVN